MKLYFNSDLLKSEIEKRKMSKTQFARECGISFDSLKRMLSSDVSVKTMTVVKLVVFLKLKFDDFVYEE